MRDAAAEAHPAAVAVSRRSISSPSCPAAAAAGPPLEALYAAAREAFPGVPLGRRHVHLLHRAQPQAAARRSCSTSSQHATCPIVHAADDRSVMETLESPAAGVPLDAVVHRRRGPTASDPSRYRHARFNPYGASTTPNPDNVCDPPWCQMDPRQRGAVRRGLGGRLPRARRPGRRRRRHHHGADAGRSASSANGGARPRLSRRAGLRGPGGGGGSADGIVRAAGIACLRRRAARPARAVDRQSHAGGARKVAVAGFRPATVAVHGRDLRGQAKERPLPRSPLLELGAYAIARLEG